MVATGYSASITYTGLAKKQVVEGHEAIVTYLGVRVPEPEAPKEETAKQSNNLLFPVLASSALIIAGAILGLFYFLRKKRGGN